MRFCGNCGREIENDLAKVCPDCGKSLNTNREGKDSYGPSSMDRNGYRNPPVAYNPRRENENYYKADYYDVYSRVKAEIEIERKLKDKGGCGWMLLGGILPILLVVIIYFLIKGDYPNRASDFLKGRLIAIGVVIGLFMLI